MILLTCRDGDRYGRRSWLNVTMTGRSGISGRWSCQRPGALVETGDPWEPYYISDPAGGWVGPVSEFLRDLQAAGRPATTQRSYSLALLRWFRFSWAVGVAWDQATRAEARDFCRWIQLAGKPGRPRWRAGSCRASGRRRRRVRAVDGGALRDGAARLLRLPPGGGHRADREPVPAGRGGPGGRTRTTTRWSRSGAEVRACYRPRVPQRVPRQIPDEHVQRAVRRGWLAPGPGAGRVLGLDRRAGLGAARRHRSGADPGQQLITVIRKGSRAVQQLPASPDAFVWLRLYQERVHGLVPAGPDEPLWWTLRRPFRPLVYHAARAMFDRATPRSGPSWTLHDLRHTAAYRMARDPEHADHRRAVGPRPRLADVPRRSTSSRRPRTSSRPRWPTTAASRAAASRPGAGAGLPAREPGRAVREGTLVTAADTRAVAARQLSAEALAVMGRLPPRPVPATWKATAAGRFTVMRRMLAPPFLAENANAEAPAEADHAEDPRLA